jgi:hypothetical protein
MEYTNTLLTIVYGSTDFLMMFAPCIGFFIQISKIKKCGSSEGFSKAIILILLIANILRIFFWIGKRFSIVLLIQSISMMITQLYLLYICLLYSDLYKNKNIKASLNIEDIRSYSTTRYLSVKDFWNWSRFIDYIYFLAIFIIGITIISSIFGFENMYYIEIIGALAAGVEAILGVPQVMSNYIEKSTGSLSVGMITLWLLGDSFKTFYFLIKESPIQLVYCGAFQTIVDILIIIQIVYYNSMEDYKIIDKSKELLHNKSTKFNEYNELNKSSSSLSTNDRTIDVVV